MIGVMAPALPRALSAAAPRRGLIVTVAALLGLTAQAVSSPPSAAAQSRSYTIRTHDGFIMRIGTMRTSSADGPRLANAIRIFGRPSAIDPEGDGSDACVVEWRRLRLRAVFANFGIESACSPRGGRLQAATIRSTRFRTTRGIRVGSRSAAIPQRHRNAEFVGGVWWIASALSPYGENEQIPTITAVVRDGRVGALRLWVGAAGD
jgi:hypothetical protein